MWINVTPAFREYEIVSHTGHGPPNRKCVRFAGLNSSGNEEGSRTCREIALGLLVWHTGGRRPGYNLKTVFSVLTFDPG